MLWAIALFAPNPEILAKYRYSVLFAGFLLLMLTAVLGTDVNGARLWLEAGPVQVQTAELVKVALVVFLAAYLSDNLELVGSSWRVGRFDIPPIPYLAPMGVMWGLCIAALLVLNDLGTALLFFSLFSGHALRREWADFAVFAGHAAFCRGIWPGVCGR